MIENKEIEASKGNNEPFELKGTTVPEKNISTNIFKRYTNIGVKLPN